MRPQFSFVPVMDHEIHVTTWGDAGKPALVMWHGLARSGRDFDELAEALSDTYFVLCPDTIGRGLSSWSQDPEAEYSVEYYAGIATDMLDHFGIERCGWIGTSLGGLIGMHLASGHQADRLRWLVINDIGPEVPQDAIDRILSYAGIQPRFETMAEAERWFRQVYIPFGPAADEFWRRMARCSVRRMEDGAYTLHFDPKITVMFEASPHELSVWDRYARITTPVHVIRGKTSDVLPEDVAGRMTREGPCPSITLLDDCGHAPTLSRPEDIERVRGIIADLGR